MYGRLEKWQTFGWDSVLILVIILLKEKETLFKRYGPYDHSIAILNMII